MRLQKVDSVSRIFLSEPTPPNPKLFLKFLMNHKHLNAFYPIPPTASSSNTKQTTPLRQHFHATVINTRIRSFRDNPL